MFMAEELEKTLDWKNILEKSSKDPFRSAAKKKFKGKLCAVCFQPIGYCRSFGEENEQR